MTNLDFGEWSISADFPGHLRSSRHIDFFQSKSTKAFKIEALDFKLESPTASRSPHSRQDRRSSAQELSGPLLAYTNAFE